MNIKEKARALWDACPTPKQDWDQLTEVTQGVWIRKAQDDENIRVSALDKRTVRNETKKRTTR